MGSQKILDDSTCREAWYLQNTHSSWAARAFRASNRMGDRTLRILEDGGDTDGGTLGRLKDGGNMGGGALRLLEGSYLYKILISLLSVCLP